MEVKMKRRKRWLGMVIGLLAFGALLGCSKDPISVDLNSDDEIIQQLVEENMDYITSAGVDDNGAQPVSYEQGDLGKITAEITPIKFGRRGKFQLESIHIDYVDDLAIATIEFSYDGDFYVVAEDDDPASYGTLYKKEMKNKVTRRAIFRKNANATESENPKKRWRMRRVSGSLLVSPSTQLEFESIMIKGENEEWTFTNPLEFIRDLESIPTFAPGEKVQVFVQLEVNSSQPDTLVLRYRNNRGMHRARKGFRNNGKSVDVTANDKVYSGEWIVGQKRGIFHAFADAFDEGCIKDDVAPYNALAWGFPYIVKNQ